MRRRASNMPVGGWSLLAIPLLVLSGCKPSPSEPPPAVAESVTNYDARGVVVSLKPEKKEVVIRHEEIPGYMAAMTMPFEVRDTNELLSLHAGDGVTFRMQVTGTDGWIDRIQVVSNATTAVAEPEPEPPPSFRVLPNVPDLKLGDEVPNYSFTNQFGKRFDLASFRGRSLGVTFIFTRCPFPTFCPRVTEHFGQVQKLMLQNPSAPTNWSLLTLTFDPEFDTPQTMKAYGNRWKADPKYWTLATGAMDQIEPFAISTGLYFGRGVRVASMNHNLRTLVIGPDGRLQKLFMGNEWTPAEMASALTQAAEGRQ